VALTTHILQTCYVTVGQASEVLYAVAGQGGSPDVVDVLLRTGAELRPFDGRTALHAALGNGHEEVATALVAAASPEVVASAVAVARANDFGPIARRIEARMREVAK
jgi:ankyrin repeat protein